MLEIIGKIAEHGTLGLLLAASCWLNYKMYGQLMAAHKLRIEDAQNRQKQLEEAQALRVEDAKAAAAQVLDMLRTCTAAISNAVTAQQAQKEALVEVRDAFDRFADEIRRDKR